MELQILIKNEDLSQPCTLMNMMKDSLPEMQWPVLYASVHPKRNLHTAVYRFNK